MHRDGQRDYRARMIERRMRMGRLNVVIADGDSRTADVVKRALFVFGFRRIDIARDGEDAFEKLKKHHYHLLITESRLKNMSGTELVQKIRAHPYHKSLKCDMPIIMLTAESEKKAVEMARDMGANEFMCKPFNAEVLADRIIQTIDIPRIFVQTPIYSGPCRRRKPSNPPGGIERRKPPPITKKRAMGETTLPVFTDDDMLPPPPQPIHLIEANLEMGQTLGFDTTAREILNEDAIIEAQNTIEDAEGEFVVWARDDIEKLEAYYLALVNNHQDKKTHSEMLSTAYAIKSQAGIFGYNLGTEIAGMLVDYLIRHETVDSNILIVIRKHIDTISIIFSKRLKNTGGEIAREFIKSLMQLIEKFG